MARYLSSIGQTYFCDIDHECARICGLGSRHPFLRFGFHLRLFGCMPVRFGKLRQLVLDLNDVRTEDFKLRFCSEIWFLVNLPRQRCRLMANGIAQHQKSHTAKHAGEHFVALYRQRCFRDMSFGTTSRGVMFPTTRSLFKGTAGIERSRGSRIIAEER